MKTNENHDKPLTLSVFNEQFMTLTSLIDRRFNSIESRMATKDDLKGFATKDDIRRLSLQIVKNSENIKAIQNTMATKADLEGHMKRFDDFRGGLKETNQRSWANKDHIETIEETLKDHESRLTALEKKPPSAA